MDLPSPKRAILIVLAVVASIAAYNFIRSRFAPDTLPELSSIGEKKS